MVHKEQHENRITKLCCLFGMYTTFEQDSYIEYIVIQCHLLLQIVYCRVSLSASFRHSLYQILVLQTITSDFTSDL